MKIAFIGCGEVGLLYAKALAAAGHELEMCGRTPHRAAVDFCAEIGATLRPAIASWIFDMDGVFSCVTGSASLAVARQAMPAMQPGALFADMTTCDPTDIRKAAQEAVECKIVYADIAIMGAVALSGVRTNLLAAGVGAALAAKLLTPVGAPLRLIENGKAGDAAALKILRSVFTKGLEALTVECFLAAEKQGVTARLHEALADIDQNPLQGLLEALVRTHVVHAPRRLKEVEEAERQLHKAELPADVLPGVRAVFERTCRYIEQDPIGRANPSAAEAFAWLLDHAENERLRD